jgi:outer membrane protein OmpA-like peptidoglycan-associated protein
MKRFLYILVLSFLAACSNPQPGPDKTLAGAVLGAGWGAGAGAVVGNQISREGEGVAVGAGFGAVQGALSGINYDLEESTQLKQEHELASLKIQNMANTRELSNLQGTLDNAVTSRGSGMIYQTYFDPDATNLRSGAVANLEQIAESLKADPHALMINVDGHADDAGSPEYNQRLSEARARTVSAYLAVRGISSGHIRVQSFGSTRPVASNATPVGRQLNRRVDVYVANQ